MKQMHPKPSLNQLYGLRVVTSDILHYAINYFSFCDVKKFTRKL